MVLLVTEVALLGIPEEQSPTQMIEGVLGELAPKVKANKARAIEEEEGQALLLVKAITKTMTSMMKTELKMLSWNTQINQLRSRMKNKRQSRLRERLREGS